MDNRLPSAPFALNFWFKKCWSWWFWFSTRKASLWLVISWMCWQLTLVDVDAVDLRNLDCDHCTTLCWCSAISRSWHNPSNCWTQRFQSSKQETELWVELLHVLASADHYLVIAAFYLHWQCWQYHCCCWSKMRWWCWCESSSLNTVFGGVTNVFVKWYFRKKRQTLHPYLSRQNPPHSTIRFIDSNSFLSGLIIDCGDWDAESCIKLQ